MNGAPGNGKRRSRFLRDDNQKSNSKGNGKSKRRSRFPGGMTERKAKATAAGVAGLTVWVA
jgi:hypothetical protein